MSRKCIVIVLDGCGIGEAPDVAEKRPLDKGANTLAHICEAEPGIKLPNLTRLGIFEALNYPGEIPGEPNASYSRIRYLHDGADTFYGHQEIMGSKPKTPISRALQGWRTQIIQILKDNGYQVRLTVEESPVIVVNEAMTVADNIECDLGSAINVTGSLDLESFEEITKVGKLVRSVVTVPRVIAFGGRDVLLQQILKAKEVKGEYVGINAPKSGVYQNDYHCVHMGYGIDVKKQIPHYLKQAGLPTYLVGKVADIVENPYGESYPMVPTDKVLEQCRKLQEREEDCFICCNVQETDLAGHSQDAKRYREVLETADYGIGKVMEAMGAEDILMVIADHGNDPTIGHSRHTREYVPLLLYGKNIAKKGAWAQQDTLANVGASVCAYLGCEYDGFGKSFVR